MLQKSIGVLWSPSWFIHPSVQEIPRSPTETALSSGPHLIGRFYAKGFSVNHETGATEHAYGQECVNVKGMLPPTYNFCSLS